MTYLARTRRGWRAYGRFAGRYYSCLAFASAIERARPTAAAAVFSVLPLFIFFYCDENMRTTIDPSTLGILGILGIHLSWFFPD